MTIFTVRVGEHNFNYYYYYYDFDFDYYYYYYYYLLRIVYCFVSMLILLAVYR